LSDTAQAHNDRVLRLSKFGARWRAAAAWLRTVRHVCCGGSDQRIALDDLCGRLAAVYVKLTCARQSALHLQLLALATSNIQNAAPSIAATGDR
jgi:hypothetical protein